VDGWGRRGAFATSSERDRASSAHVEPCVSPPGLDPSALTAVRTAPHLIAHPQPIHAHSRSRSHSSPPLTLTLTQPHRTPQPPRRLELRKDNEGTRLLGPRVFTNAAPYLRVRAGDVAALANYDFEAMDDSRIHPEREVRAEGAFVCLKGRLGWAFGVVWGMG